MTNLELAIQNLNGFSLCLCKNENYIFSNGTGISPMMNFISEGRDLTGWSAADIIVGKAVAMLFIKSGIISVYGKVMSINAKEILDKHDILCKYEILTDKIINRKGTDICPMEKTVKYINDIEEGYQALRCKLHG